MDELEQGVEHRPWPPARWLGSRWDRTPRSLRTAMAALAVAVAAVLVWQAVQPVPKHAATTTAPSLAPASALLSTDTVCTTLTGETLEVTFRLTNTGQRPVQVTAVRPALPLGMLLALGSLLNDNGRCGSGPLAPGQRTLAGGASMPVTFRLIPLVDCAQPAPVQAAVTVAGTDPSTITIPVLPDLGSVSFPGCRSAVG